MSFAYQAYDRAGRELTGSIDAASAAAAREALVAKGLFVTSIGRAGSKGAPARATDRAGSAFKVKPRLADLAAIARQLSILVATGTPVADALRAAERQATSDASRAALASVRAAVEQGSGLGDAMEKHPALFDEVTCSLVAAGEASGTLDTMLGRIAAITRQQLTVARAVRSALAYPAVLMAITAVVLLVMLMFVVPRFAGMFESLRAPLPATTELLVGLSSLLRAYWWLFLPGLAATATAGHVLARTRRGAEVISTALITAPGVGGLVRSLASTRIARLLGVLLQARIPLVDGLALVERSMTQRPYRELVAAARRGVIDGESLSDVLARSPLITPAVAEAVRNGEATARLGEVLHGIAQHLDEDNAQAVRGVATLIEPAVVLFMGLVIGSVALSMFLPLFDLTATAGSGGR